MKRLHVLGGAALAASPMAWAHVVDGGSHGEPVWFALDPWSWLLLIASALLYLNGRRVLRRRARSAKGAAAQRGALLFCCGWLMLAVALGPPLDPLGGYLFSVHMLQHELLMLVAAPMLVLSRPGGILLWGLPAAARLAFNRMQRQSWLRSGWAWLSSAHGAWLLHAAILWGWHLPALFDASVLNDGVHAAQHASFFGSALLFWWALLHGSGRRNAGGVIHVFTTAVHSSLLGALLTFSPALWYAPYLHTTAAFGLSPLDDQQLGGLIMWVPSGLVFLAAGLVLTARFLRDDTGSALAERDGGKGDD
nr:cytochrome c oxidase assembly protein [uncultured Pseudomonas sp.]